MAKKSARGKSPTAPTPGRPKPPAPPPSAPGKPSPPRGGYPGPKKLPSIRGDRVVVDAPHKRYHIIDFGHRLINVDQAVKAPGAFSGLGRGSLQAARVRTAKPPRGGFPGPKKF